MRRRFIWWIKGIAFSSGCQSHSAFKLLSAHFFHPLYFSIYLCIAFYDRSKVPCQIIPPGALGRWNAHPYSVKMDSGTKLQGPPNTGCSLGHPDPIFILILVCLLKWCSSRYLLTPCSNPPRMYLLSLGIPYKRSSSGPFFRTRRSSPKSFGSR